MIVFMHHRKVHHYLCVGQHRKSRPEEPIEIEARGPKTTGHWYLASFLHPRNFRFWNFTPKLQKFPHNLHISFIQPYTLFFKDTMSLGLIHFFYILIVSVKSLHQFYTTAKVRNTKYGISSKWHLLCFNNQKFLL